MKEAGSSGLAIREEKKKQCVIMHPASAIHLNKRRHKSAFCDTAQSTFAENAIEVLWTGITFRPIFLVPKTMHVKDIGCLVYWCCMIYCYANLNDKAELLYSQLSVPFSEHPDTKHKYRQV